ncbi:hypothetical protein EG349_19835 (plasmid) [Chryseobacterium shandongense]|jgi:hypothetical protein|uniref:Uncharacterized protein n=1 Tax=Chryseobacterium shandongense TaxID=1493872 RepID=A0AAD0YIH4_9FLAO|nr:MULTISPECIES: hypothetical protein [Chryseobacterium]AZA89079.1 hypothetical protein EG349_19835 [Chryseobacterium shandongense]AZA98072.1 hypothetical protein EG353_21025 [Chryseobacterium shandongense]
MSGNIFQLDGFDDEIKNIKSNDTKKQFVEDNEIQKISLNMYKDDWEDLLRYRTYVITDQKKDFSQAEAFIYGLKLLDKKYKIKRGQEKISLDRGRREGEKREKKSSSIDLPSEWLNFINDFLYHKKMNEGIIKYSRLDMISEMISLIKQKNKEIPWN